MGGRLSAPRGPDGVNESSKPTSPARLTRSRGIINGRVGIDLLLTRCLHADTVRRR
jgi:hypothetical protein